jgi:hypothetical protein
MKLSKRVRRERWSKVPTQVEIDVFDDRALDGAVTEYPGSAKWVYFRAVQTGWRCPCCNRTAHELIRWTINMESPHGRSKGMRWNISGIVKHHCHQFNWLTEDATNCRFETTMICGECNTADGLVKYKFALPEKFSFSPDEIRQFVKCTPYSGNIEIDYDKACELYLKQLWEWETEIDYEKAIF